MVRVMARVSLALVAMLSFGAFSVVQAAPACAAIVPGGAQWYGSWSVTMRQNSACSQRAGPA